MLVQGILMSALAFAAAMPLDSYHKQPMPYQFQYAVQDKYAGQDFGQQEKSDGNIVQGSYSVALPDGRKQTVNYKADHHNGYVAEVSYYGKAQYPSKSPHPPFVVKPSYH